MSGLVSKVLAGGVSAGVFLLWWPAHVTAAGGEWLFVRGIMWSLAFEILLLAYGPLERSVVGAVRAREPRRLGTPRVARVLILAAAGVAVPLVMLAGSKPPAAAPARALAPKVIVKREIVRREVVVRRVNKVVRVPGAPVTTAAPRATAALAAPPATRSTRATATPSTTRVSTTKTVPKPAGAQAAPQADTTAAPTPAATTTAAQPTTAAKVPAATATASEPTPAAASAAGR